jgi:hypothetical protein
MHNPSSSKVSALNVLFFKDI